MGGVGGLGGWVDEVGGLGGWVDGWLGGWVDGWVSWLGGFVVFVVVG